MTLPRNIIVNVVTPVEDDVEKLNQVLRRNGFASHCKWHRDGEAFAAAIDPTSDMIIVRKTDSVDSVSNILAVARKRDCQQPVVALHDQLDEAAISECMACGAVDLVTLTDEVRLRNTLTRELNLQMLYQQVANSRSNAASIQKQFTTLMDNVPDAIAHVQEGIIVETNKAWLELFGYNEEDDCIALPLMDAVAPTSHGAVKGALVAINKGRWNDEPLQVSARKADGKDIQLTLSLQSAVYDDEPAVRVAIKPEEKEDKRVTSLMRDAMTKDQSTFLYHRRHFLKLVDDRLGESLDSGQRLLAWVRIDKFKDIRNELGVIESEDVISEFAEILRKCLQKEDIAGRFEGTAFTILMERSSENDAIVWCKKFAALIASHHFEIGDRTIGVTCSIGIAPHSELVRDSAELVEQSEATYCEARNSGDGKVRLAETSDEDTRIRNHDAIWAKRLTAALKDNRFRLLKQPIAALDGDSGGQLFDILMRLVDEQGDTVAPAEFLPAARRNNMMQALDRWVIGASVGLCRERKPELVFVRLSDQSITDRSFGAWLKTIIAKSGIEAKSLCFQVPEETALKYLKAVAQTAALVRNLGCRFALEHVGNAPQSKKLLNGIPLDYAKIDGALITALSADTEAHSKASELVSIASSRGIKTIAEKVQDANTMAALWQLGISYMQGHYVQEPEVILQETA